MNEIQSLDSEPPLLDSNNSGPLVELSEFLLFQKHLSHRLFAYILAVGRGMKRLGRQTYQVLYQVKKFFIRLLMFRGGYFYQTHRLGLATITSTTVFSLFLVPFVDPIQELNSLSTILDDSVIAAGTDELVLQNASGAYFSSDSNDDMRNEVVKYTIENGDTISTISEQFLVSAEALKYANSMGSSDLIHPGDVLTIPPVGGLVHEVDDSETISSIAELYSVSPQAIVDFNHLEEPFVIFKGDELVVPDAKVPQRQQQTPSYLAQSAPAGQVAGLSLEPISAPRVGNGGFIMPASGVITQYFWWGHTAIDIANSGCGSPIIAADSGTITFAGWWPGGGGNSIFVDHGNGFVTKYAHLSGFAKTAGGVERGEVIGYMGATGRAFGCHLHFIMDQNGRPINPLSVL